MMTRDQCIELVHERAISVLDDAVVGEFMPCELCGSWEVCERHHRQFRSRGGLWVPSNILLLCEWDHMKATDERAAPGVNVSQFGDPRTVPVQLWYTDEPVCLDDEGGYDPCCGVDKG